MHKRLLHVTVVALASCALLAEANDINGHQAGLVGRDEGLVKRGAGAVLHKRGVYGSQDPDEMGAGGKVEGEDDGNAGVQGGSKNTTTVASNTTNQGTSTATGRTTGTALATTATSSGVSGSSEVSDLPTKTKINALHNTPTGVASIDDGSSNEDDDGEPCDEDEPTTVYITVTVDENGESMPTGVPAGGSGEEDGSDQDGSEDPDPSGEEEIGDGTPADQDCDPEFEDCEDSTGGGAVPTGTTEEDGIDVDDDYEDDSEDSVLPPAAASSSSVSDPFEGAARTNTNTVSLVVSLGICAATTLAAHLFFLSA